MEQVLENASGSNLVKIQRFEGAFYCHHYETYNAAGEKREAEGNVFINEKDAVEWSKKILNPTGKSNAVFSRYETWNGVSTRSVFS